MDLNVYFQLIFLCVLNIIFTFSGIILNTLVIASFWKSSQLRKKLCQFMIMVLSCADLISVVTNHPGLLLYIISWLVQDYDLLTKMTIYVHLSGMFLGFSVDALLVMSIERYLGTYYPISHRTSVTKRRLLTLFVILIIPSVAIVVMSMNGLVISVSVASIIFIVLMHAPLMFVNVKLYMISIKVRREKATSPEKRTKVNLKSISTCLLAVVILVLLSSLAGIYALFGSFEKITSTSARLFDVWARTVYTMNCTSNSLVFFWKNKVLRAEGRKILKTTKYRVLGLKQSRIDLYCASQ